MRIVLAGFLLFLSFSAISQTEKPNILLIISDDLTANALGAYGNQIVNTPHIDQLASEGVVFKKAYSQYPVCGPSRASFMFGYYPSATETYGYISGRENVGDFRKSLAEFFKSKGYYTARVSKIFHMGVPIDIETGSDGTDDPASWTERFNSQGPEWTSPGKAELAQNNPDGSIERKGGNVMTIVQSEGGDLAQSDGKTAEKAIELIQKHKDQPFFLAVGLVRPHVPFVTPENYFQTYPWQKIVPPAIVEGDWDDIPKKGINYVTTQNSEMSYEQKQKAIAGYYASVSFMDAQVGKILNALKKEGLEKSTIVIFTSDHGFHLGEHDFWMKVSLKEESVKVPLIIKAPGISPGSSDSFAELVDLYPTLLEMTGHEIPNALQGKSLKPILNDPKKKVREFAFSVTQGGETFLIRTEQWAYIQYGKNGEEGVELFDMYQDPGQFQNLALVDFYKPQVEAMKALLAQKIKEVQTNDLGKTY
ncbi:choline-sulfatase [Algoriphagus boseongensis]|uniref:Choline-sulfatase n=1 Tax=Algoriphagus boseongensis TaxID=1442587 RepID=A0A4R6T795_9BACT|nr:sulfatase [Algoriphagus boseongensis]TDQ16541.1 choline-sulfatase [Algoriphagus boseongensis]